MWRDSAGPTFYAFPQWTLFGAAYLKFVDGFLLSFALSLPPYQIISASL